MGKARGKGDRPGLHIRASAQQAGHGDILGQIEDAISKGGQKPQLVQTMQGQARGRGEQEGEDRVIQPDRAKVKCCAHGRQCGNTGFHLGDAIA